MYNMTEVLHGVQTGVKISSTDDYLFDDIPDRFNVCRYHSWAVRGETVNGDLIITSEDDQGVVMGISHKTKDVKGLQFHPESILTENGIQIIKNWLEH